MKVAVFDGGWGGELFADYLEMELGVLCEVIRVIDWKMGSYIGHTKKQIRERAIIDLEPVVGYADVIVIASFGISAVALDYLRQRFPGQKFVGFKPKLIDAVLELKRKKNVLCIAPKMVSKTSAYRSDVNKMKRKRIHVTEINDVDDWIKKIDDGELDEWEISEKVSAVNLDAILLYETQLSDLRDYFERIYGWKTACLDQFRDVVDDVYKILKKECRMNKAD